jgi:predicted N-acetyltransferase YhbS
MIFSIRRTEPSDYEAVQQIFAGPKAIWGTLQTPFSSVEQWRKRLAEPPEGLVSLVACVESEVIGQLSMQTFPIDLGVVMWGRLAWQCEMIGREKAQVRLSCKQQLILPTSG